MCADWISAAANVSIAIATWVLVWFAYRGLTAWTGSVNAAEEIERKKLARQLTVAMKDLAHEIMALREGRLSPSELEAGETQMEGATYKPKDPSYYVTILDRLLWRVHRCKYEAAFLISVINYKEGNEINGFILCARTFRNAFAHHHLVKAPEPQDYAGKIKSFSEELDATKLRLTLVADKAKGDPFGVRLNDTLYDAVKVLEPYIDGRVK